MYHPGLESLANMTAEYPIKFLNLVILNIVLYFMTNLKREAGAFFIFFLITYVSYITMSSVFRTVGAATKTVEEAMGLAGVLVLALVIYCGCKLCISLILRKLNVLHRYHSDSDNAPLV
jgi:ABC-type multidrug transport system permease subunit